MKPTKSCSEATRLKAAFGYSLEGLKAAYCQPSFRVECWVALIALPMAFALGTGGTQKALLAGSVLLVLIVELLNTGVESAIDRISLERHPLSKAAKDVGSAAVLLSILNAMIVWLAVLTG